jgi:hypothetical protein
MVAECEWKPRIHELTFVLLGDWRLDCCFLGVAFGSASVMDRRMPLHERLYGLRLATWEFYRGII